MKKSFLSAILGLSLVTFAASCSKSDPTPPPNNNTVEGTWVGSHNNNIGGPVYYFSLNFKTGGAVVINANSSTAPEIANGTWALVGDSVRATYTFVSPSATFSLAGKYSASSNIMNGTIGVGSSTSGSGVFSVTRQ